MIKKILAYLLIAMLSIVLFSGCNENKKQRLNFDNKVKTEVLSGDSTLENKKYSFSLDADTAGFILTDKTSGKVFSTSAISAGGEKFDELGMPIKMHPQTKSVLLVKYLASATNTEELAVSYSDVLSNGRVRKVHNKDSITVEFYFDSQEFMVPVTYKLTDEGVKISIDTTKIQENNNKIISISLAPFFSSVENDTENSYLFIPEGSGAITETKTYSQQGISYSSAVYGADAAIEEIASVSTTKYIRLPVFGVKSDKDKALFGIIEQGDGSAYIDATVGATATGFSSVYPTFFVRGYANHQAELTSKISINNTVFSENMIDDNLTVNYYPICNNDAGYNNMAEIYKTYLSSKGVLNGKASGANTNVSFIGGAMLTKSFLGIPYKDLYEVTSINRVEEIVTNISENTNSKLNVELYGFQNSGIDISTIGKGYNIADELGNKNDLESLNNLCKKISADLYVDFETNLFNKSSVGFSTIFNSVTDASKKKAAKYLYRVAARDYEKDTLYYLLNPSLIPKSIEKLISKTESMSFDGYSLRTLTSLSYSDYSNNKNTDFYSKNSFGTQVKKGLESINSSGKKIMSFDANVYAATKSSAIIDTPVFSSGERIFKEDIPFYSMVFSGYTDMFSEYLNLSSNPEKLVLQSVEAGVGISYLIGENWDSGLIDSNYPVLYNYKYSDVKPMMKKYSDSISEFYNLIKDSHISKHEIINKGLRKTYFDNGISVLVNYNDNPVDTEHGEIDANSFKIVR